MQTESDAEHGKVREDRPPVRLVVNADDFGRSEEVVAAVSQAYDRGILTSASLMVTGAAATQAVEAARVRPGLGVGLHLVLARGRAASRPQDLPHLVDEEGRFRRNVVLAGLCYAFSPAAKRELARELRAQFERFQATGLPLSHVDSHHHLHLHPMVFRLVLSLAHEFGARAIRVNVADDLRLSLRCDRRHLVLKLGWKIVYTLLAGYCRRLLRRRPLPAATRVYGLLQSGNVTPRYLLACLEHVQAAAPPLVEIFCHPSLRAESSDLGPNPGDLAALLDPRVREAAQALGIRLVDFHAADGE